jgi:SAM-dependent methyltransferase
MQKNQSAVYPAAQREASMMSRGDRSLGTTWLQRFHLRPGSAGAIVRKTRMMPLCNICGSTQFESYRGRPAERCAGCGAKARHRIARDIYGRYLEPERHTGGLRILHLAPEAPLHGQLRQWFGAGYLCADAEPARYLHAEALRLFLPDGFAVFPDGFFFAVLHNHVLEHIPGSYCAHLAEFARILRPGGLMIFSVPGPHLDRLTEEGGEHMSETERLARFRQVDHLKIFGADFTACLEGLDGGELLDDGITEKRRAELSVRPGKAKFFVWRKHDA